MPHVKDEEVEARAVELARADRLAWVKLPHRDDQPDTPAGATNAERDGYRRQARGQLDDAQQNDRTAAAESS